MKRGTRTALVAAAIGAMLAFAGGAFAANTGTVAVWHTPMVLGGSSSTTIHITLPQATDPIAAINIYVPAGYTLNTSQAPGTNIGSVDAAAFSHDNNLTLPLSGTVTTDAPANHVADSTACARTATSAAVWILNLSVAGQTIALPLYVNPTAGAEQGLGAYKLSTDRGRHPALGVAVHAVQPRPGHGQPRRHVRDTLARLATGQPDARRHRQEGQEDGRLHGEGQVLRGRRSRLRDRGDHRSRPVGVEAHQGRVAADDCCRNLQRNRQGRSEEDDVLQSDGQRRPARLHGTGLRQPAARHRCACRLRKRDVAALVGDEHRREGQVVTPKENDEHNRTRKAPETGPSSYC